MDMLDRVAFVAAVVLPLWNIPLIVNVIRRRSSRDFSLWWVMGVWICILLMAPSGFRSTDAVWKIFNIMNLVLFTAVVIVALKYRHGPGKDNRG